MDFLLFYFLNIMIIFKNYIIVIIVFLKFFYIIDINNKRNFIDYNLMVLKIFLVKEFFFK